MEHEIRRRLMTERLLAQRTAEVEALRRDLHAHAERLSERLDSQRRSILSERQATEHQLNQRARDARQQADIAEERLRAGIDTIRDGFAIFNAAQELVIANHAYLAAFRGFDEVRPGIPFARILEICALERVVDIGAQAPADWIATMLTRWEQVRIPECVLHFTSGHSARLLDRRAGNGDVVSLARDITQTLQHEADLDAARARAEAANRAKSAFLANMSHEIRTPMNGVVGMAELLCESELTAEQRLYAQTIRSSGEAMLEIIGDVLDYSRIEAEMLRLAVAPFDLERCIHDVLVLLQPSARASGLALTMDYDLFAPVQLMGDSLRVRQIMLNLVGNAIKFTESGHVLVRVVGLTDATGQYRVSITVEDTGIGIPAAAQESIFDEFCQVEDAHNRKFDGTGLGLAITRRLVTLMGGDIWVESTPGEGACFGVSLPLPVVEPAPAMGKWPLSGSHALILDTRSVEGEILRDQLQAMRIDTTLCTSRAAFSEQLTACTSDRDIAGHAGPALIVISDSDDPGECDMLVQEIAASKCNATTVLLSETAALTAPKGTTDRFDLVLPKPVLRRDLLAHLHRLATAQSTAARDTPPPDTIPGNLRAMRVLSAEDNRTNRLVFSNMIKGLQIDLQFATDGAEAVSKFHSFAPDLIFMDISMPGMDGGEATQRIREDPIGKTIPIVALTAHTVDDGGLELKRLGMTEHQTKPLRKAAIVDAIRRYQPPETCALDPDGDNAAQARAG